LMLDDEPAPSNSEAILIPIMEKGKLIYKLPNLNEIQKFYLENIKILPGEYKKLEENQIFKLKISEKLKELTNSLKKKKY